MNEQILADNAIHGENQMAIDDANQHAIDAGNEIDINDNNEMPQNNREDTNPDVLRVDVRKISQKEKDTLRMRYSQGDETLVVSSKAIAAMAMGRDVNIVSKTLPVKGRKDVYTYNDLKNADDTIQQRICKQSTNPTQRIERANKKMKTIASKPSNVKCSLCMEYIGKSKFICCWSSHYYCNDCIDGLVTHATAPCNLDKFKKHNSAYCLNCPHTFSMTELVNGGLSDDKIDDIIRLREDIAEARGQDFVGGIETNDLFKRNLKSKVEAIFIIKCPTCNKPISDEFANNDECAAFKCADGHPSTSFCGICGLDCSDGAGSPDGMNDAHWHVRNCHYNMNPLEGFGTALHKNMYVNRLRLEEGRKLVYGDRLLKLMLEENVSREVIESVASDILNAAGI